MATSLLDIRFMLERQIRPSYIDNADFVIWCNEANDDIGMNFNLPADAFTIALNTTTLEYALPEDLKIINRLRLQSVIDSGLDTEFQTNYRIYNGKMILPRFSWIAPDTLVIDYFKHLTVFTDIDDLIELDDRYNLIYMYYGLKKHYELPETVTLVGEQVAMARSQSYEMKYNAMKAKLTAYQSLSNEPNVVQGRW